MSVTESLDKSRDALPWLGSHDALPCVPRDELLVPCALYESLA